QLVTSRVGLSPILENPGSQITGSARNIGGRSSVKRSMRSGGGLDQKINGWYASTRLFYPNAVEALCKVRGEIDVEFRDEANAADLYKVVVLVS
nr:transcription elongation factor S-II, central domain-containing protein [Tanacetum cinerariifolium]